MLSTHHGAESLAVGEALLWPSPAPGGASRPATPQSLLLAGLAAAALAVLPPGFVELMRTSAMAGSILR